jgi:hypothetical protein
MDKHHHLTTLLVVDASHGVRLQNNLPEMATTQLASEAANNGHTHVHNNSQDGSRYHASSSSLRRYSETASQHKVTHSLGTRGRALSIDTGQASVESSRYNVSSPTNHLMQSSLSDGSGSRLSPKFSKRPDNMGHRLSRGSISSLFRRKSSLRTCLNMETLVNSADSDSEPTLPSAYVLDRKSTPSGGRNMPMNLSETELANPPVSSHGTSSRQNNTGNDVITPKRETRAKEYRQNGVETIQKLVEKVLAAHQMPKGVERDLEAALHQYTHNLRLRYSCALLVMMTVFASFYNLGWPIWVILIMLAYIAYVLRRADAAAISIKLHLLDIARAKGIVGKRYESVEWVNHVIERLWPLINRELFTPVIDLMEVVMKEYCPRVVYAVRITHADQGIHPFRIRGIRVIHPDPNEPPRIDDEFTNGIHIEADFAYRAMSKTTGSQMTNNAHIICHLSMGVRGVGGMEVPAFVQLLSCTGTVSIHFG